MSSYPFPVAPSWGASIPTDPNKRIFERAFADKVGNTVHSLRYRYDIRTESLEVSERLRNLTLSIYLTVGGLDAYEDQAEAAKVAGWKLAGAVDRYDDQKFGGGQIVMDKTKPQLDPETGAPRYSNQPKLYRESPNGMQKGLSPDEERIYMGIKDKSRLQGPSAADPFEELVEAAQPDDSMAEYERLWKEGRLVKEAQEQERERVRQEGLKRLQREKEERERAAQQRTDFYQSQDDFGLF